jgi:hypothetical protein
LVFGQAVEQRLWLVLFSGSKELNLNRWHQKIANKSSELNWTSGRCGMLARSQRSMEDWTLVSYLFWPTMSSTVYISRVDGPRNVLQCGWLFIIKYFLTSISNLFSTFLKLW